MRLQKFLAGQSETHGPAFGRIEAFFELTGDPILKRPVLYNS